MTTEGNADGSDLFIRVLAAKWTSQLLLALEDGPKRFYQLRSDLPMIAKKILIENLHRLTEQGFIEKRKLPQSSRFIEYAFTREGKELLNFLHKLRHR